MRVLISGAGIGGPVAAVALRKAGIDAVVYEAHDAPSATRGLHLGLAPNGLAVLRTLGMLDAVLAAGAFPASRIEFTNGSGRRLGPAIDDHSSQLDPGLQTITITRGGLQTALAEAATALGARIEYGKRLVRHTDTGTGVVVEFADGTTAEGDVLIGADGIHSPVRAGMDPAAPRPEYTGLLNIGGRCPAPAPVRTPESTTRMVFGSRAFFGFQTAPSGETYWFVNVPHRELSRAELAEQDPGHWKRHVLDLFADDLPVVSDIIRPSDERWFQPLGTYDIATLPRWSKGRVGLLGDAAHAVSSSSGQGASQAVEDAATLARCLRDIDDPARALRVYESLRRERVEKVVAEGRRRGNQKLADTPVKVFLRDLILPVVFRLVAMGNRHSWIFDHRIDFEERVAVPTGV